MTKQLSQLLPSFTNEVVDLDGNRIDDLSEIKNIPISNLVFDSREVTKDTLFFALPGIHTDGNLYIPKAILNGANAVVYQGELSDKIKEETAKAIIERAIQNQIDDTLPKFAPVLIKVPDSRFAMAPLSSCFYDNPSERLIVIGVTGTEGKSSTVSFIWQLLNLCGQKAGFISTVEYSFGGPALPNPQHQTTPEAPIIQSHLNKMLENGCKYAVVESSSHGLSTKLNRCGNILFDCGVFMNVTLEHLEFHKTFDQYKNDKANLFRALDKHNHIKTIAGVPTKINSIGIVNLEDPSFVDFINATNHQVYGYTSLGKAGKAAVENSAPISLPEIPTNTHVMTATDIVSASDGISFNINAMDKNSHFTDESEQTSFSVNAKLPGAFNAYNLMASIIAVSSVTDLSFEQVAAQVPNVLPIKGRMTVINEGQDFEVIVDYAHTPSSFETIFPPLRKRCQGKMIALFGSGCERDLTKRPLQGQIAAQYCNTVILADEDPRGENPEELLKMIAVGAEKEGKELNKDLFIIPPRPQAIAKAFSMAQKGDIVLLLGKSHENSIIYKDFVMPYDEIKEARKQLNLLNKGK